MSKSVVSIVKGTDAREMVAEALSLLGGVHSLIESGSVVVIKPNAGHPFPPETSVNTSPAFVTAVIQELRRTRPKEIILAEAAAKGCDTLQCLEISGIGKAARDAGVDRIIDIKLEKDLVKVPIPDAKSAIKSVYLPKFLTKARHLVNLPIFKSHTSMVFTCALKNIKGVVQDNVHLQMHQTDLAAAMMDLWSVVKADISVVDMIRPAEGFGPQCTSPVDFGCVVAGLDPVAVDATICRMVGLGIEQVHYFEAARNRGIGRFDEEMIEIRGKKIEEVFKQLWIPYLQGLEQWPEYNLYTEGACSSCEGLLSYTMERLKAFGEYDKNAGISILAGPKKQIPQGVEKENLILFGDCVKKYRRQGVFIRGCPPTESVPAWSIINRLDSEKKVIDEVSRQGDAEAMKVLQAHVNRLKEEYEAGIKKKG